MSKWSQRVDGLNIQDNWLLAALPAAEAARLAGSLEAVERPVGAVLCEAGKRLRHLYFPTTMTASMMCMMQDGGSTEAAIIGYEGLIGASLLMGSDTMPVRAVVQGAGLAFRVEAAVIEQVAARQPDWRRQAMGFAQALFAQIVQTVGCNRYHTIDQRLCRWLLFMLDRQASCELHMTQEMMAAMLGVRREGVTEAAGKLQAAGMIHYNRGHIVVTDRPALESRVCECYGAVRAHYDRLLAELIDSDPTPPTRGLAGHPLQPSMDGIDGRHVNLPGHAGPPAGERQGGG